MENNLTPLKESERLYTYHNSSQISGQTGFIGYLRADMGSSGKEFWSTWNDYRKDLNTQPFKDDIDSVINTLREKGNILADRSAISKAYHTTPESHFKGELAEEMEYFGFRVNTNDYAFLLRLTPRAGEYNLYCYCYRKDWLDSHLEKAAKGIRFIDSHYNEKFRIPDGDVIRVSYPDGSLYESKCRYIDEYHIELDRSDLYHICEFAEMLERNGGTVIPMRSSLPDQCYVFVQSENKIGIVNKGTMGYTDAKAANGLPSENRKAVEELNRKIGVTPAQAEAMKSGSMFGWDKPAADPKNYTEKGTPIKPKNRNHEAR